MASPATPPTGSGTLWATPTACSPAWWTTLGPGGVVGGVGSTPPAGGVEDVVGGVVGFEPPGVDGELDWGWPVEGDEPGVVPRPTGLLTPVRWARTGTDGTSLADSRPGAAAPPGAEGPAKTWPSARSVAVPPKAVVSATPSAMPSGSSSATPPAPSALLRQ